MPRCAACCSQNWNVPPDWNTTPTEPGLSARTRFVVEREVCAGAAQLVSHRNQRRDADATRHENVPLGILDHRKMVAWLRHDYGNTGLEHLVNLDGATAALILSQNSNKIFAPVRGIAGKTELPDELRRHRDVDVSSGLE